MRPYPADNTPAPPQNPAGPKSLRSTVHQRRPPACLPACLSNPVFPCRDYRIERRPDLPLTYMPRQRQRPTASARLRSMAQFEANTPNQQNRISKDRGHGAKKPR